MHVKRRQLRGLSFSQFKVYRGFLQSQEPLKIGQEVNYFGYQLNVLGFKWNERFGWDEVIVSLVTNDPCAFLPDPEFLENNHMDDKTAQLKNMQKLKVMKNLILVKNVLFGIVGMLVLIGIMTVVTIVQEAEEEVLSAILYAAWLAYIIVKYKIEQLTYGQTILEREKGE